MQEREETYRLYSCRCCSMLVSICGRCDHGNIYCPGECAAISRRAAPRTAAPAHDINSRAVERGGTPLDSKSGAIGKMRK